MADQEWDVLVAFETLLKTIDELGSVTIGLEDELLPRNKFPGKLPATFIEYVSNEESGPQDSSDERYVPFDVPVVVAFKEGAGDQAVKRRLKMQTAIKYKNYIANKLDSDPQLGGLQVELSAVRGTRVLMNDERVPRPYWAIEIMMHFAIWETKGLR